MIWAYRLCKKRSHFYSLTNDTTYWFPNYFVNSVILSNRLPNHPGAFSLRCCWCSGPVSFVGFDEFRWGWQGWLNLGHGANGVFQKELFALAAEKKEFEDLGQNALTDFARSRVLGTFYRPSHTQSLKRFVKLRNNLLFAINVGIFFRRTGSKTRIFLMHEKIKLITEGVIALKSRKGIHLDNYKQVVCQIQETPQ